MAADDMPSYRWTADFSSETEVCTIYIHADFEFPPDEARAWSALPEIQTELRQSFEAAVHARLGRSFRIRSVAFGRGSLEIVVIIAAVVGAISAYGGLREGIDYLASDLAGIATAVLGNTVNHPVNVQRRWSAGAALSPPVSGRLRYETAFYILLGYVLLSHAALLAVFIWIVASRLNL